MKITSELQAQQMRPDGYWFEIASAIEVDAEAGLATLAGPTGAVAQAGIYRVVDAATGEVLAATSFTANVKAPEPDHAVSPLSAGTTEPTK